LGLARFWGAFGISGGGGGLNPPNPLPLGTPLRIYKGTGKLIMSLTTLSSATHEKCAGPSNSS